MALRRPLWQGVSRVCRASIMVQCHDSVASQACRQVQKISRLSRTYASHSKATKPIAHRRVAAFSMGLTTAVATIFTSAIYLGGSEDAHLEIESETVADEKEVVIDEENSLFKLAEVAKHDAQADRKWVIHGTQVFDITDFIEAHPGGDVILRACGRSIDSYWNILKIHDSPAVREILQQYYLGDIHPGDLNSEGKVDWTSIGIYEDTSDPFWDDPKRDAQLMVHTSKPCNAETPASLLSKWFITPTKYFFVRNHLWVPRINPEAHTLSVEFSDGEEASISLKDLKSNFPKHTITATLQCAGNRRKHMSESKRGQTMGLQWDVGAISTAEFSGVRLCDFLRHVGYNESVAKDNDDQHIHFSSGGDTYSASIPLATALSPSADVLLVYEMNGEPINRDHGGPLRVLVPGSTAARSVKWVGRVTMSSEEAHSQWQRRDYKCFAPNVRAADVSSQDWEREQSIQETPVQSAITNIVNKGEKVSLQGFAFSGGGRAIVRVDVSDDDGKTWQRATIRDDNAKGSKRWAWTLWDLELPNRSNFQGSKSYLVKATDNSYNTQPETFDSTWNFRGLLANAWHRATPGELNAN